MRTPELDEDSDTEDLLEAVGVDHDWIATVLRGRWRLLENAFNDLTARLAEAELALTSKGYRRSCDIPACNCGETWAHGGHADERLRELSEALAEWRQGRTLLGAVEALISALTAARKTNP